MQVFKYQELVKGKYSEVDALTVNKAMILIGGRVMKTAQVCHEYYDDVGDPEVVIQALKAINTRVDLVTFIQRPPDTMPKYRYHLEWEGIAALPITSFDQWWKKQILKETRRKIKRADNAGVEIRHVPFTDELVHGIMKIFNETPVKGGRPFWHYGKDFSTVKNQLGKDLDRSEFIAAFHGEEMIGFVKLLYAGGLASPVLNLSMLAHRDKMPGNALMAEVVRICASKNIPFVFYGVWKTRRGGMREFLENNGFTNLGIPRYYVPLTIWGGVCLRLTLHRGITSLLPENLTVTLLKLREIYYQKRFAVQRTIRLRS